LDDDQEGAFGAVCTIHAHPLGVEVRLDLDDELHRSEVIRCATPVRQLPDGSADYLLRTGGTISIAK
jgi:hypothetical protein